MASRKKTPPPEAPLRAPAERRAAEDYARLFSASADPVNVRLASFPKYVRRQDMTRLLACYEIFKRVLPVKGSVVECGVFRGSTLMAWANFSAILEPNNLTRRIYGFDSFGGFPATSKRDGNRFRRPAPGDLRSDSYEELLSLIRAYDMNRFLGHVPKVQLVRGDVRRTIPSFVRENPHLVVSLLFLDLDLYVPTAVALKHFVPRIPRGGVIAFDELDNPMWPGETLAALRTLGLNRLRIERLDFDPYIGFVVVR